MPALQLYDSFADEMAASGHNLKTDTFKIVLTNTAPDLDAHTVWNTTVAPPPAAANGYPAGGGTLTFASRATVNGVFSLVPNNFTFNADGGNIGPFQHAVILNSSKSNKVVAAVSAPSVITIPDGGSETIDFQGAAIVRIGAGTVA